MIDDKAFEMLLSEAESGDVISQNSLAARYATGDGVDKDLDQTIYWYKKASLNDDPDAFYNLALMYLLGEGVDKDDKIARINLNEAIECGSSDACLVLAEAYENGNLFDLNIDFNKAAKFYLKATLFGSIKGLKGIASLIEQKKINSTQFLQAAKKLSN